MTSSSIRMGTPVACTDGPCGAVTRIVIDPAAGLLTHVAVVPRHGAGRLVPSQWITSTEPEITLACTRTEFDAFRSDQDQELLTDVVRGDNGERGDLTTLILFDAVEPGLIGLRSLIPDRSPATRTFDRVPAGDEELQPSERVKATDGPIGRVSGVTIDLATRQITHLLVDAGHLWGKHHLAVPMSHVEHIGISVQIDLTQQQIGELDQI